MARYNDSARKRYMVLFSEFFSKTEIRLAKHVEIYVAKWQFLATASTQRRYE